MNPLLFKLILAAGVLSAVSAGGVAWHHSIYAAGTAAGEAKVRKEIADANAESARKNATIVKKDQEILVAKTEDKEKIVTIYKTIREQMEPQIVEKPVFTTCRVGSDSLRLLTAAAAGGEMPANSPGASSNSPGPTAGAKR